MLPVARPRGAESLERELNTYDIELHSRVGITPLVRDVLPGRIVLLLEPEYQT